MNYLRREVMALREYAYYDDNHGWRCRVCNTIIKALNEQHIIYLDGCSEPLDKIIITRPYCPNCHGLESIAPITGKLLKSDLLITIKKEAE